MPDETRAEALEAAALYERIADALFLRDEGTLIDFDTLRGKQIAVPVLEAALRTIQQETARETWERAIEIVQQLPRAEAIGVMSGMLDKTYRRTKPLSEIRELVAATPTEDQR